MMYPIGKTENGDYIWDAELDKDKPGIEKKSIESKIEDILVEHDSSWPPQLAEYITAYMRGEIGRVLGRIAKQCERPANPEGDRWVGWIILEGEIFAEIATIRQDYGLDGQEGEK